MTNLPDLDDAFFTGLVIVTAIVVVACVAVIAWSWYAFLVKPPVFYASEAAASVAVPTLVFVAAIAACFVAGILAHVAKPWAEGVYWRIERWFR